MTLEMTIPISSIVLFGYDILVIFLLFLFFMFLFIDLEAASFILIFTLMIAFFGDMVFASMTMSGSGMNWSAHYIHPINWAICISNMLSNLVNIKLV